MSDRTFDPSTWFDAYRETFAPVYKAQQEGLKTLERFARFQYAVAGDCLDSGLAHVQAAVTSKSPAEFVGKQAELSTRFGEKLSSRMQEFVHLTTEAQGNFTQVATETASKAVANAKKTAAAA